MSYPRFSHGKKRALVPASGSVEGTSGGEAAAADDDEAKGAPLEMASSEGYHALLQLLRAKTPAELLKASSRLCAHVADSVAPTPGAGLASAIRKECNEILLSNGKEVDLAMVRSPTRTPCAWSAQDEAPCQPSQRHWPAQQIAIARGATVPT